MRYDKPKRRTLKPQYFHLSRAPRGWRSDPDFVVLDDATTARDIIGKLVVCCCRKPPGEWKCRCHTLCEEAGEMVRESGITISRCSLGSGRWFWIAFRMKNWFCDTGRKVFAEGEAGSAEQAEADARLAVNGMSEWVEVGQSQWAQYFYRDRLRRQRIQDAIENSEGGGARVKEYVYNQWVSDSDSDDHWSKRLIAKKTKTRVYVYCEYHEHLIGDNPRTFALDRQKLERGEWVWSRSMHEAFCLRPEEHVSHQFTPDCIAFFGLTMPCDLPALKRAYAMVARKTHPDHGGDAEAFKAAKSQFEKALTCVKARTRREDELATA